jgi:hypothetical protein
VKGQQSIYHYSLRPDRPRQPAGPTKSHLLGIKSASHPNPNPNRNLNSNLNPGRDHHLTSPAAQGRLLGIRDIFTPAVAEVAVGLSGACDTAVAANASRIYEVRLLFGLSAYVNFHLVQKIKK